MWDKGGGGAGIGSSVQGFGGKRRGGGASLVGGGLIGGLGKLLE